MWSSTKLRDFFANYDPTNPNHLKAADLLQQTASQVMSDSADWVRTYRGQIEPSDVYLDLGCNIIENFEGFRANPYLCPAGVWTIGYGSTYYPNGSVVQPDDRPISKQEAKGYLMTHLNKAVVPTLASTVPTWGAMNSCQKAAIISFAYNLGAHFYGSSGFKTITKALSTKDNWKQVPSALMLYVNPGSSFEAGLKRRRKAEGDLWTKTAT